METQSNDPLVPDHEARRQLGGISKTTSWRWEKRGILHPVRINNRKYYRQSTLNAVKNGVAA
jgi:DNA-binding transcriptional MerR regulator